MFRRIRNYLEGIEPCLTHCYELTDVFCSSSWSYQITCSVCRKRETLKRYELLKKCELGLVILDKDVEKKIFGYNIKPRRGPDTEIYIGY